MIKLLPLVVLVAVVLGVFVYFNYFKQGSPQNLVQSLETQVDKNYEQRIKTLEGAVLELASKVGVSTSVSSSNGAKDSQSSATNTESRLNNLEVGVSDLQGRVKKLEGGASANLSSSPQTQTKSPPVYILSLGSGDSTKALDWTVANNIDITVDPANFPGYTSMQLEAQIKVLSGNGKVFARLYDSSAGTAVLSSEVSTAAENFSWVSSQTFTLGSGKKTYKFQIKTLTGYEASIQAARIKVNF